MAKKKGNKDITSMIPDDVYLVDTSNYIAGNRKNTRKFVENYYKEIYNVFNYTFDNPDQKDERLFVLSTNQKQLVRMSLAEYLIHLYIWEPNVIYNIPVEVCDFYELRPMTKGKFNSTMDKIIERFVEAGKDIEGVTQCVANIRQNLTEVSDYYASYACCTFSLFDIMAFESRNPAFRRLINTQLDDKYMSIKQMEDFLLDSRRMLERIIIEDRRNCLYPYVSAGVLNTTQIAQMFVAVGPRADIDKNILPKPISQSYLHGVQDPMEYYIESVACLNALIIKKKYVPDSGYLSRKINLLCSNTQIDYQVEDCGSTHYLDFFVETPKHLEIIVGKFRVDENGKLVPVRFDDFKLIGTVVHLRSHTTCITGHKTGQICKTCVGKKAMFLMGTRLGSLASIKVMNPISQLAMSAKHQTSTKSEEIEDPILLKFFNISSSRVYLNNDIDQSKFKILLPLVNVEDAIVNIAEHNDKDDEDGEGIDFSIGISEFYIEYDGETYMIDTKNKKYSFMITEEFIMSLVSLLSKNKEAIQDLDITEFYEDEDGEETIESEVIRVKTDKLNKNTPLFNVSILTEEVSVYLKMINNIFNSTETRRYATISDIIRDICEVLINSGIGLRSQMMHVETIVRNLLRSPESKVERPKFDVDVPEYRFIMLNDSIKNQNIFIGIAFEALKRQLRDLAMVEKTEPGVFDQWFITSGMIRRGIEYRKNLIKSR